MPGEKPVATASRPHMPGYGIPKSLKGILPWSHVEERLERAKNYWVGTATRDSRPHVVPVWALWVDGALCFGGGPETRWMRNLGPIQMSRYTWKVAMT